MILKTLLLSSVLISGSAVANFASKTDGEAITISGKVSNVKAHSFTLKTGDRDILVEMDDHSNWIADGFKLVNGDEVVVTGRVDQDFLEKKKIEAGSVYVKNINTYFYASSADEEDYSYIPMTYGYFKTLPEGAQVDIQGKVTKVDGRELTVDTGLRKITVDTKSMMFNPLDKTGFTKIDVGDRVRVSGEVQDEFFDSKEVSANSIIELPVKTL